MFRRTLSVLLCLCMLLTLLPAAGITAFAEVSGTDAPVSGSDAVSGSDVVSPSDPGVTTPTDVPEEPDVPADFDGVINKIEITGFTGPFAGEAPDISLSISSDPVLKLQSYCYWTEKDSGSVLDEFDKFENGKTYSFVALIVPPADTECTLGSSFSATINGSAAAAVMDKGYIRVTSADLKCAAGRISDVAITGVSLPRVGQPCSTKAISAADSNFKVTYAAWMCYDSKGTAPRMMSAGEKFADGKTYFFYAEAVPSAGYVFNPEYKASINGSAAIVDRPFCGFDGSTLCIYSVDFDFSESASAKRIAGSDRMQTAVEISKATHPEGADSVVIASGDTYADALAGVSLAYSMDAPILLVRGSKLDDATLGEIDRLGASSICIVGGASAISADVVNALMAKGCSVSRIAGDTRFDTAVEIAKKLEKISGKAPEIVFFAYSHNYPDALAVSNIAALKSAPVLYIGADGKLDSSTESYLAGCTGLKNAYIIGGTSAINPAAETNIGKYAQSVERISGSTRYDTCLAVDKAFSDLFDGKSVCLATGTNYPDALAGGVFAACSNAPLILVDNYITDGQTEFIGGFENAEFNVFGGTTAVPNSVVNMFAD